MMLCVAHCRRAGFTLIEIMIVIAIIAILAGIAIPNIAMARFEAYVTGCQKNCETIVMAVQMALIRKPMHHLADECGWFYTYSVPGGFVQTEATLIVDEDKSCVSGLVEQGYLNKVLTCPRKKSVSKNYELHYWSVPGSSVELYRSVHDFTDTISVPEPALVVCCSWGHYVPGWSKRRCDPAYCLGVGPCFYDVWDY